MSGRVLSAKSGLARGAWITSLIGFMVFLSTSVQTVVAETGADAVDVTTLDGDALVAWVDARADEFAVRWGPHVERRSYVPGDDAGQNAVFAFCRDFQRSRHAFRCDG